MSNTIVQHGVMAELTFDKYGPAVILRDADSCADSDARVVLHPQQLRAIADHFLPSRANAWPSADALAIRLRELAARSQELHELILASRGIEYCDMSHELAQAGALASLARAFCVDLMVNGSAPEPVQAEPQQEVAAVAAPHAQPHDLFQFT
jgi:hypothetical protein